METYIQGGNQIGPIQNALITALGIAIDRTNQIIYTSDPSSNLIQEIGYPSIYSSPNPQSNYEFSMDGFGFCDQICSTTCNQISLFQNSIQIQNISISLSSCSFNNIQFSVSSNILNQPNILQNYILNQPNILQINILQKINKIFFKKKKNPRQQLAEISLFELLPEILLLFTIYLIIYTINKAYFIIFSYLE